MSWLVVNIDPAKTATEREAYSSPEIPCVIMGQRVGTFALVDRDGCNRSIPMLSFSV